MLLYVLILLYQYQVCDWQYRAPSTSSIHSSSSANTRNIWSSCGKSIRSSSLPYTTRRALVLQYWYSHTRIPVCVAAKRCRYHAIGGSLVCTWSTDGTVHYIWYCCTRTEVRSLSTILGCSCHVMYSGFLVGPRISRTNENECIHTSSMSFCQ